MPIGFLSRAAQITSGPRSEVGPALSRDENGWRLNALILLRPTGIKSG